VSEGTVGASPLRSGGLPRALLRVLRSDGGGWREHAVPARPYLPPGRFVEVPSYLPIDAERARPEVYIGWRAHRRAMAVIVV